LELTDLSMKSINNLNCSQDGQLTTRSLILRVEMFSINFVTFAFCKLLFCHNSLENIASIAAFDVVPLPAAKQRIFNHSIQNLPILCLTS